MVNKNTTVLICGFGSIGVRHFENLVSLGISPEHIVIYRTGKNTSSFEARDTILLKHKKTLRVYSNLDEALIQKPDVALITNPTALHVSTAIRVAHAGCHLLIEKPLSHSFEGIAELQNIAVSKDLEVRVAYNMRFHPHLARIKKILNEGILGEIVSVEAKMSERITLWHPWENYRTSYATRKDLGGGAILTQSHELDYLHFLFGKPQWVFAAGGSRGNIATDTENISQSILGFSGFAAEVHIDYFKSLPQRSLEITGTQGWLYWNCFGNVLDIFTLEGTRKRIKVPQGFERNTMFINELKWFFEKVKDKQTTKMLPDLLESRDVLAIALATNESLKKRKVVDINY